MRKIKKRKYIVRHVEINYRPKVMRIAVRGVTMREAHDYSIALRMKENVKTFVQRQKDGTYNVYASK